MLYGLGSNKTSALRSYINLHSLLVHIRTLKCCDRTYNGVHQLTVVKNMSLEMQQAKILNINDI